MTNSKKLITTAGLGIILLVVMAGYFLNTKKPSKAVNNDLNSVQQISVDVPVNTISQPKSLNIAKRRGVCRTMNTHLVNYATATNANEAQLSHKAITALASQMLNYYAFDDSQDNSLQHQTLASPNIWVDKREFRDARQKLIESLRETKASNDYAQAAISIKQSCQSCHQKFLKSAAY